MRGAASVGRAVSALVGMIGLSVVAGVLIAAMVTPVAAVTGVSVQSSLTFFQAPEPLEISVGSQQNTIAVMEGGAPVPLATVYDQNRQVVPLDRMSVHLQNAAIAGEDRRYFEHSGVDLPSVARAAVGQVLGSSASGASTVTMQLVRNILIQQAVNDPALTDEEVAAVAQEATETTLERKVLEMRQAVDLEEAYTKEQILEAYLNIAGFGANTYGVEAAAQRYFSRSAGDVTIAQAASIIAIVQSPTQRNLGDPANYAANQERRDVILTAMRNEGYVSVEEFDAAIATPVDAAFVQLSDTGQGCYYAREGFEFACDYAATVVPELAALGATAEERIANWRAGGYTLVTTLDPALQETANALVQRTAPPSRARFEIGAASSSVEAGTGRILVMAQNRTYDNTPAAPPGTTGVNLNADLAHGGSIGFQPGSTYKPFVLLAHLAEGGRLEDSYDAGVRRVNMREFSDSCGGPWVGPYSFRNDANESGRYTVARATAQSVNSVFIQMAEELDQCEIAGVAESLGVSNASGEPLATRPSCSIGGCENTLAPLTLAAAYAAIANGGVYCAPILVDRVLLPGGGEGPGQSADCSASRVDPEIAARAIDAMQGVMSGTAAASNPNDGTPYFGKTGTTDDAVHTWMVGSSSEVATAVWVGNVSGEQNLRSVSVAGRSAAVLRHAIFRPLAQAIDDVHPGDAFAAPTPTRSGTPERSSPRG